MKSKTNRKLSEEQSNRSIKSQDAIRAAQEFAQSDAFEAFFERTFDRFKSKFSTTSTIPHLQQSNVISVLAIHEFKSMLLNDILNYDASIDSTEDEEIFLNI